LGSTNGTFLNDVDHRIPRHHPITLESGDRIFLGARTRIEIRAR